MAIRSARDRAGLSPINFYVGSRSGQVHLAIPAQCVEDEGWATLG